MTSSRRSSSVNLSRPSFERTRTPSTLSSKTIGASSIDSSRSSSVPGIVEARGSAAALPEVLGDPVLGDPAGDALAERDPELVRRLVDVLADLAEHRDRDEVVADQPVDAGVVVVDQLAQLAGDRLADLVDARQPAQARAELLDGLELGRPRRHPLEVLGRPDGDARLGRQRADRVEFVVGPVVRLVVVDVEHPEQVGPVEERRRAQRVEPLLDDGGPDALAARVVAVADREQRPAGGDGGGSAATASGMSRMLLRYVVGQAAADLADRVAVRTQEEDRAAVALEQHHRVIHQPGQDPVEIEPRADVAGDPAERLRPMEQVGDLVGAARAGDERPDRVGDDPGDVEVARAERAGRLADDQQRAPWLAAARDRDGQLGPAVRRGPTASRRPGRRRAGSPASGARPVRSRPRRQLQRLAEDPEAGRQVRRGGTARRRPRSPRPAARAGRRASARSRRGGGRTRRGPPGRRSRAPRPCRRAR